MMSEYIPEVLGALDAIIQDPLKRLRFVEHPDVVLREAGYDSNDVPSQVWDTLTHMTFEELKAISDLAFALTEAGLLDGTLSWRHVV